METEQSVSSKEGQDTLVLVLTLWIESVLPHLCAVCIEAWETRVELIYTVHVWVRVFLLIPLNVLQLCNICMKKNQHKSAGGQIATTIWCICNLLCATQCTITTPCSHAVSSSVAQTVCCRYFYFYPENERIFLKCYTALRSRIIWIRFYIANCKTISRALNLIFIVPNL